MRNAAQEEGFRHVSVSPSTPLRISDIPHSGPWSSVPGRVAALPDSGTGQLTDDSHSRNRAVPQPRDQ